MIGIFFLALETPARLETEADWTGLGWAGLDNGWAADTFIH